MFKKHLHGVANVQAVLVPQEAIIFTIGFLVKFKRSFKALRSVQIKSDRGTVKKSSNQVPRFPMLIIKREAYNPPSPSVGRGHLAC